MTEKTKSKELKLTIALMNEPRLFKIEAEGGAVKNKRIDFYISVPLSMDTPGFLISTTIDEEYSPLRTVKTHSQIDGEVVPIPQYKSVPGYGPINEAIHKYELSPSEHKALLKFWYPNKRGPRAKKYTPDIENPHLQVDPKANEIFGILLEKILEGAGYKVVATVSYIPARYPIVKVDRTTVQELFPMFINKGIFTNYMGLPTEEEVLNKTEKRLKKTDLTFKEKRQALSKAGEYRARGFVMRDYGDYAIGFSAHLYIDYLKRSEQDLIQAWKEPSLFDNENKAVEDALKRIRLYKLAHKLSYITLAEVYLQKTLKGVVIPKQKIVEYLGYDTNEKQIYQDIKEAYLSLRWLEYKLFDYSYTDTGKEYKRAKGKGVGFFIYNFEETQKHFSLDINEKFVGCIAYLFGEKIQGRKERKRLFGRGYLDYLTSALPLSRDYSTPAYLLNDFLIRDSGNKHHRKKGLKAIVYNGSRYVEEAHITHSRANRRWKILLSAIKEVEIVKEIEPSIMELETLKPSKGLNTKIIMYIKAPPKALDDDIKKMLKQRIN